MELTEISTAVSTVGFPILCCIAMYRQNGELRKTIDSNTKAIDELSYLVKSLIGGKHDVS